MRLSRESLQCEAAATGFQPGVLEKVTLLLEENTASYGEMKDLTGQAPRYPKDCGGALCL